MISRTFAKVGAKARAQSNQGTDGSEPEEAVRPAQRIQRAKGQEVDGDSLDARGPDVPRNAHPSWQLRRPYRLQDQHRQLLRGEQVPKPLRLENTTSTKPN